VTEVRAFDYETTRASAPAFGRSRTNPELVERPTFYRSMAPAALTLFGGWPGLRVPSHLYRTPPHRYFPVSVTVLLSFIVCPDQSECASIHLSVESYEAARPPADG
jgi:hypothetical protein